MFISTVVGLIYRETYVIFLFHWHLNETIFSCLIVVNGYDPQMFNKDYTNKNISLHSWWICCLSNILLTRTLKFDCFLWSLSRYAFTCCCFIYLFIFFYKIKVSVNEYICMYIYINTYFKFLYTCIILTSMELLLS